MAKWGEAICKDELVNFFEDENHKIVTEDLYITSKYMGMFFFFFSLKKMEFFNTEEMKKEFYDLIHVIIPLLNECGHCGVEKCVYCPKFSVKNCFMFKSSKEFLMKNSKQYAQEYLGNFLTDFLKISKTTVVFFNLPAVNDTVKEKNNIFLGEKELKKHSDFVKNYVNNKVNYMVKGRKRTFFR